jgi:gas vesicle protein
MKSKGVWIAFAIGVAAGAAVALLYAPQSGIRTRRQLRKSIDEGVGYLEDAADYLKDQAENLSKEANKTIARTREQMESMVDRYSGAVGGAMGSAVKGVQSLM